MSIASPVWTLPLRSSVIASAAYHPMTGFLDIQLSSGACYRYLRVPMWIYAALFTAESKGQYFNRHIKNAFNFVRC